MKKILLEKLLEKCREQTYQKQYEYIMNLLEEEKIKPVKASRLNGKSPALYREYWVLEEKKDYSTYIEELRYEIVPDISVDYYLRHLESYEADRTWVLELNQYLKNKKKTLQFKVSVNERSFEIWGQEKFLSRGQGKRILNRCGLELSFFNIYETTEPLAYYSLICRRKETKYFLFLFFNRTNKADERNFGKGKICSTGNFKYFRFLVRWRKNMQYEFLKNFPRRMKNVGLYAVIVQNSIQKLSWKQYGFTKFDEQINLLFIVLLYIMEQSLKEEKCTMDDIATYIDTINVQYMQKDISYEQCRKLFKMQAINTIRKYAEKL